MPVVIAPCCASRTVKIVVVGSDVVFIVVSLLGRFLYRRITMVDTTVRGDLRTL